MTLYLSNTCQRPITQLLGEICVELTLLNEIDSNSVITDLHLSASKSRSITSLVKRSSWRYEVKGDIQNETD